MAEPPFAIKTGRPSPRFTGGAGIGATPALLPSWPRHRGLRSPSGTRPAFTWHRLAAPRRGGRRRGVAEGCSAFRREDLDQALSARRLVKPMLMRSTLHIVSACDYLRIRQALQPVLSRDQFYCSRDAQREQDDPKPALCVHLMQREDPAPFPTLHGHMRIRQ
ncbi:MAG: crosslink repair DNA glycosylase YcaQ family protein [Bacillota bacterium]|nr:crosslink repair DNA glycosylase YcaQ family protein [Symbiobacterium thermophilum]PZN73898.1 MAG: hypothetical protein DIU55_01930 [Bacillota bacterium]